MLKRAQEVIASGDEKQVVDYAIEANRQVTSASAELDKAKAFLRSAALRRAEGAFSVELEGHLGVATVSFARSEVKIRKNRDLRDLEVNLPAEVFSALFAKEILIRPVEDFADRLADLHPSQRVILDRFIEVRPSTPKVHLTK
jgi:hypothetical protein